MTTINGYENQNDETDATAHHFVFVYGTLMSGFGNHDTMHREGWARLVGRAHTTDATFRMEDWGFPALFDDGTETAVGEVYEVDAKSLAAMDRLEGNGRMYTRALFEITIDGPKPENAPNGGTLTAWVYIMPTSKSHGTEIAGCDYRAHRDAPPVDVFGGDLDDDDDDFDDDEPIWADDDDPCDLDGLDDDEPPWNDDDPKEIEAGTPLFIPNDDLTEQQQQHTAQRAGGGPGAALALAVVLGGTFLAGCSAAQDGPQIHGRWNPDNPAPWRQSQRDRQAQVEGYPLLWQGVGRDD
jgi:gamma-glutamylcyclotransferase (GGCT)/AIG2-like uncharacterized protein YtfP